MVWAEEGIHLQLHYIRIFASNNFIIDGEESSLDDADSSFRVYGLWFESMFFPSGA